jgi:hypothetical protein
MQHREKVALEILTTEQTYFQGLEVLIEVIFFGLNREKGRR